MPTLALELWMMPVTMAPTRTPSRGVGETDEEVGEPRLVLQRSHCVGHGSHAGHQDGKKPMRIVPMPFFFSFLPM